MDAALTRAAPCDLMSLGHNNDGTDADIEDSTTIIVSQVTSRTLSLVARTYPALRYSKLLQGFLLAIVSISIVLHEAPHFYHRHHSNPSVIDPPDLIEECIYKLTGMLNPSAHPAYSDVENWFLNGPGKSISPPDLEDCNWKTDFAKLFALLTLRAALNITTTSWCNEHTVIESTVDICRHHWHRIGCNDNNEIVALHLSNGNFAGTIPSELGAITTLKRIELYKNFDIDGTIPSEVGNLVNLEILHLHQTSLSGSLPSSIGKLTELQELFVDDTNLEGDMPREICSLRATTEQKTSNRGGLIALHADCGGSDPKITCDKTCCNFCYDHHRNHTTSTMAESDAEKKASFSSQSFVRRPPLIINDSVEDIKTCQENGIFGQRRCIDTVISTGEHCVYCTKDSPNDPDDKSACLTPTLAQEALTVFKRDGIRCSDALTDFSNNKAGMDESNHRIESSNPIESNRIESNRIESNHRMNRIIPPNK